MTGGRSAPLCWGQRYHWLRYHQVPEQARHDAHIVLKGPLPAGASVAQIRLALNLLIRRHEALRTVYDALAHPWPLQRVQPPAPLPLTVVTTEQDGTPRPGDVVDELTVATFDLAADWPVRACVVTTQGVPRQLVMVLNHVCFDDWSLDELRKEFYAVVEAMGSRRPASLPPVANQPVDLARAESARQDAEVRVQRTYWQTEIARVPADMFAYRRDDDVLTTAYSASLTSPELLQTTREIAHHRGAWTSAVHLTAYIMMMGAYSGVEVVAPSWLTSHRDTGAYLSVMTCMFSPALVPVDLAGDPRFSEVLARVVEQTEGVRAAANVPYDEIVEMTSLEGFRRGQPVRAACEVNFLNYAPRSCGTRRDRFTWNGTPTDWIAADTDTYTRIYEWQDGITVGLTALSRVMDADTVERFLRGYGELLTLHRDPATDLRLSEIAARAGFAPPPARRTACLGGDTVDLDAVEAVLCGHPEVLAATVDTDGRGLVARVGTATEVVAAELRAYLLDVMHDHAGVRCPDWFDLAAPGLAGDGRADSPRAAATSAERALAAVVSAANGLATIDLSLSYPAAGGRVLRLPRVLADLREAGWRGLTMAQLASARPLARLSRVLTRIG